MNTENKIIIYQTEDGQTQVDVRMENETVWLTQQQIANLFGTKRPAITKHLKNIYASEELDENSTCSILEHLGNEGRGRFCGSRNICEYHSARGKSCCQSDKQKQL